jgi:hypothetical protein
VVAPVVEAPATVVITDNPAQWSYDQETNAYVNAQTGKYLSKRETVRLRDEVAEQARRDTTALALALRNGEISKGEFTTQMHQTLATTYGAQYILGRGGMDAMTARDMTHLQEQIVGQFSYVDKFGNDLMSGSVSEAQARNRANMYADAGVQAHERGVASSWNLDLPAYPADGGTACMSNCRCHWDIKRQDRAKVEHDLALASLAADPHRLTNKRANMDEINMRAGELYNATVMGETNQNDYVARMKNLNEMKRRAEYNGEQFTPNEIHTVANGGKLPEPHAVPKQRVPATTSWAAEKKRAQDHGIIIDGSTRANEVALRTINDGVDVLKAKGHAVPTHWAIQRGGVFDTPGLETAVAVYDPSDKTIKLNANSPHWQDPAAAQQTYADAGWQSSADANHAIYHEVGHFLHHNIVGQVATVESNPFLRQSGWPAQYSDERAEGTPNEVSRYGASNEVELVAEVFAGRIAGKTFSPEVNALYKQLKGPNA